MLVGIALLTGLVVAWALGARLTLLSEVRFRGPGLVFAALAIQIGIFTPLAVHVPAPLDRPLHALSYLLIVGFFVLNLRVPGFWLVGFGLIANVAVIFANGGRMPVSATAWTASGGSLADFTNGISDNNVLSGPGTHLQFLSDVFAMPAQLPLASPLSVGDLLIVVGMVAFVYRACTPTLHAGGNKVLAPLRSAGFRRVIAGRLVSNVGDWLTQAAVVTWIYAGTHSVGLVSAFLVVRMAGYVIGGLASAPLLDRLAGFRALALVELLRGCAALAMIPFAMAGMPWPVILLGCVSSFLSAATSPTTQGLIPDVLPPDQLQAGNALHQVARSFTSVLGACVGGFAVARFDIQTALAVDLASFVIAAVIFHRFAAHSVSAPAAHDADGGERVSRRGLLRAVMLNRVVFGLTASFTLVTASIGVMNSASSRAFDVQFGDADAYGYIVAVIGIGYMCSELLTGTMRSQRVARRSVGLSFVATGGTIWLLSHATTLPVAYLALFLFGASDGVTEVVRDSLIQLNTERRVRSGVFAVVNSLQTAGMIAGLAVAPLIVARVGSGDTLRLVALGCAVSGVVAGICLAGGGQDDLELTGERPAVVAPPATGDLGAAVSGFELLDERAAPVTLTELIAHGPAVLVLAGRELDDARISMLRELAGRLPAGARLALVTRADSERGRALEAVRVSTWLRDHGGDCFRALQLPTGRRARDAGVFVIDGDGVLRLAYRTGALDEWLPASFVVSRLRRLMPPDTSAALASEAA